MSQPEDARPSQQPGNDGSGLAGVRDPQVRPECEDDDGYDPWSDRRDEPPLFEPDPWA